MKNFWIDLEKPLFALAPMADVTDAAFRRVIAKYSKPAAYVTYTEFVSADGLALAPEAGRQKLLRDLLYTEAERPIVAQFFTAMPKHMESAAALAQELGFDGIDINMGCPAGPINDQGAGAELIKTPELAVELVHAAKQGAPDLPVSVKTRLGYHRDQVEEWVPKLLSAEPAALIMHARTKKEMSKVPARWERVARVVEIRDELGSSTLVLGNGDATDVNDARAKVAASGADGAMLGRAIFGKPWLFSAAENPLLWRDIPHSSAEDFPTPAHRLRILIEHTHEFEKLLGDIKSFAIMKKHFKAYVEGFAGAKELRMELMEAQNAAEVEKIINSWLTAH